MLIPGLLRQHVPVLVSRRSLSFYDTRFRRLAAQPVKKFSLSDLVDFALKERSSSDLLIKSARFLQHALPIRMARRIDDMNRLPSIAMYNPHMQEVYDTYTRVCEKLMTFPTIKTVEDEANWNVLLKASLDDGKRVLPALAKASKEISPHVDFDVLTTFLDTFLTSRIARRVLAEQHLALHEQVTVPESRSHNLVGVIDLDCDPSKVCTNSYEVAARVARVSYGIAPKLDIRIHTPENYKFSYVCI
jgi:[3-methyl-2-oxobutanoate dehydrogenase (acetyl-transferring)] kinase